MPRKRPFDDGNMQKLDSRLEDRTIAILESDVLKQVVDKVSSTLTYVCKAPCGSATSIAAWQIQRITVSGTITTIEWADGDGKFDNIADNRNTLRYI